MNPMLNIAIRAARKAGNVIAKNYERRDAIESTQKGINDYVTNVDKAAEAELHARFNGRLQFGTAGLRGRLQAGSMGMNRVLVSQAAGGLAEYLKRLR